MQCKDIPTVPVLAFLAYCETAQFERCAHWGSMLVRDDGSLFENSVQHAMPANVPAKLARAKMGSLVRRDLVDGCTCGCRGDFELTKKGRAFLAAAGTDAPTVLSAVKAAEVARY